MAPTYMILPCTCTPDGQVAPDGQPTCIFPEEGKTFMPFQNYCPIPFDCQPCSGELVITSPCTVGEDTKCGCPDGTDQTRETSCIPSPLCMENEGSVMVMNPDDVYPHHKCQPCEEGYIQPKNYTMDVCHLPVSPDPVVTPASVQKSSTKAYTSWTIISIAMGVVILLVGVTVGAVLSPVIFRKIITADNYKTYFSRSDHDYDIVNVHPEGPEDNLTHVSEFSGTLYTVSKVIGPQGGCLGVIANDSVQLDIPSGALTESKRITLYIESPEASHQPLRHELIIAPVVRLEPDGLQFLRPVTLTVKHAAVGLGLDGLRVWTTTTGHGRPTKWQRFSTADTRLTNDVIQIRPTHFCIWCFVGIRSQLRVKILPFIHVDLRSAKQIELIVYALKNYDVKDVEDTMKKKDNILCLDSFEKVYDISRHQNLEIGLKDVTDRNMENVWNVKDTPQKINWKNINKGRGNACCRFDLTANDDKVDSIKGTLTVQRKRNDPQFMEVHIKHIMRPSSLSANGIGIRQLQTAAPGEATATVTESHTNNSDRSERTPSTSAHVNANTTAASVSYCNDESGDQLRNQVQIFQLILDDAADVLYTNLNPNNIVKRLTSRGILNDVEVADITNIQGLGERVKMLVAILKTKDVKAYDEFMSALREFDHVVYREVKIMERKYPRK
ncbi:uncharacterized protein [Amphiura filiformis]|uniref:uncharacterized protein n=1 Tax=Amphiura filiformis TaxID=82378 RepID=UPI003B212879